MRFVSATLFEADGQTEIVPLASAGDISWLDELNGPGSFSLTIPQEDADPQIGQIVKISWGTTSQSWVFAGIVEKLTVTQGSDNDGVAKLWQIEGRGVNSLLEAALVYNSGASDVRSFTNATPGAIMKTLLDEAHARGTLGEVSYDFGNVNDSNGDPFSETLTIDESVGTTLLAVADRHYELAIDYWIDPEMILHYVNVRGTDQTTLDNPTTLRIGQSVGELAEEKAGPVRNVLLVATGDGSDFATSTNAGSVTIYGKREAFLSLTSNDDPGLVTLAVQHYFDGTAHPASGATVETSPGAAEAYLDYQIGDTIYLAALDGSRTAYRVRAITGRVDGNGQATFIPELGSARPDLTKRLALTLLRAEQKGATGTVISDPPGGAGGGIEFLDGTVISFDYPNGPGEVDLGDGIPIEFENYTNLYPAPGDTILLIPGDPPGMIARTSSAGNTVAPSFPSGSLPTGYPFDTDQGSYPMSYHGNSSDSPAQNRFCAYDRDNQLGFGLETVIGHSGQVVVGANYTINGVVLSTGGNLSIGIPPSPFTSSTVTSFGHADGYLYVGAVISGAYYTAYWDQGSGWSTPSSTSQPGGTLVQDPDTENVWLLATEVTTNYVRVFGFSGGARTDYGRMGLPNATISLLAANSGWLCVYSGSSSNANIYTKPSTDTTNFTLRASGVNLGAFTSRARMSADGDNLYAISAPASPAQADLLDLDLTNGSSLVYSDVTPVDAYPKCLIPGDSGGWVIVCGEAVINFPEWTGSPTSSQACLSVYGFTGSSTQEIYHNVDIKNSSTASVSSNASSMKTHNLTRMDGDVVFWVATSDGATAASDDSFVIRLTNV